MSLFPFRHRGGCAVVAVVVLLSGVVCGLPSRAETNGFVQWPQPSGKLRAVPEGLWDKDVLHGRIKSIRVDAYTGEMDGKGNVRKVMPQTPEDVSPRWLTSSVMGHFPAVGVKHVPYMETYLPDGRISEQTDYDSEGAVTCRISVSYTPEGKLSGETVCPTGEKCSVISYSYDGETGRLVAVMPGRRTAHGWQPEEYSYDARGRLVRVKSHRTVNRKRSDGQYEPRRIEVSQDYAYDEHDGISSITYDDENGVRTFSARPAPEEGRIYNHTDKGPTAGDSHASYTEYDEEGRETVETSSWTFSPGDVRYDKFEYVRDAEGRITLIRHTVTDGKEVWISETFYRFDEHGNMVRYSEDEYGEKDRVVRSYDYDDRGNWIRAFYTNKYSGEVPEDPQPVVIERRIEYYPG